MTPTADAAQATDLHGGLGGPVHRGTAPVRRSGQHDPCLRRLGRLQSVSQGEVQHGALPAGRSVGHAHARKPVCQPGHGRRRAVPPGPSPVGKHVVLDLNSTPGSGLEPAGAADPADLDLRQQHERGRLRRARGIHPGGRGAHDQVDSRCPPAAGHDGLGKDDRQVSWGSSISAGSSTRSPRSFRRGYAWKEPCPMRVQDHHDRDGRSPLAAPPVPTGMREPRVARLAHDAGAEPARQALPRARCPAIRAVSFIRRARRSRPPPRSSANRSSPRASASTPIGPGQFDTQTITIHGFGKPMTSNISRKMHFQFVVVRAHRPDPGRQRHDQPGRRQLSAKLDRLDPVPGRTDQQPGQRLADEPLLRDRRQFTQLDRVCRDRGSASRPLRTSRQTTSRRPVTWLRRRARRAASGRPPASRTGAWRWGSRPSSTFPTNIPSREASARAL